MERIIIQPRKNISDIIKYDLGFNNLHIWDESVVYKLKYKEYTQIETIAIEIDQYLSYYSEQIIKTGYTHFNHYAKEIHSSFLNTPRNFITRLDFKINAKKQLFLIDANCEYTTGIAESIILMDNWHEYAIKGNAYYVNNFSEELFLYFNNINSDVIYIMNEDNTDTNYNNSYTFMQELLRIYKKIKTITPNDIELTNFQTLIDFKTNQEIKCILKLTPSWINFQQNILFNFSILKACNSIFVEPFWTIVKQSKTLLAYLYSINKHLPIAPTFFYYPSYKQNTFIVSKPYNEIQSNGVQIIKTNKTEHQTYQKSEQYKKRVYQNYIYTNSKNNYILECYVSNNRLILISFRESLSPIISYNNSTIVPYLIT